MPAEGRNYDNLIEALVGPPGDTYTPEIYRRWVAVSAIAGAMGRRTWYSFMNHEKSSDVYRLFPCNYICLIGEPATGKSVSLIVPYKRVYKGLSVNPQISKENWVESWKAFNLKRPVFVLNARISAEQLAILHKRCEHSVPELGGIEDELYLETPLNLVTSEFGTLMHKFNDAMQIYLTESWDGEDHLYTMKNSSAVHVKNPAMNWISCATPQQFVKYMPEDAGEQGLLSRMILVYWPGQGQVDDTEFYVQTDAEIDMMREDLARVSRLLGPFWWESEDFYQNVFRKWVQTKGHGTAPTDPKLAQYVSRRKNHLVKLCMCIRAAKDDSMVMTAEDFREAVQLLTFTERNMPLALQLFGMSDVGRISLELSNAVQDKGRVTFDAFHRMMLERVHSAAECTTLHKAMQDARLVKTESGMIVSDIGANPNRIINPEEERFDVRES